MGTKPEGHIQLELFRRPESVVAERLEKLDISSMTPLDALNCLNELIQIGGSRSALVNHEDPAGVVTAAPQMDTGTISEHQPGRRTDETTPDRKL